MNIEIANRLVEMRKEKGLSQEALAEKLGISRQAVSKWERAESSPDTSNLITLAKLYNVSLDELLNTNQEKFESGESIKKQACSQPAVDQESDQSDFVNIGLNGLHVKDGNDEVRIGWKGVHIKENGEDLVKIGKGYLDDESNFGVWIEGEDYGQDWKPNGIFSLVIFCLYLWIGFEHFLWHPGWLLFLTIPVISSLAKAIKRKDANAFAYPILMTVIYLYLGFVERLWHPTWILFITVPIYYQIVGWFKKRKDKSDF